MSTYDLPMCALLDEYQSGSTVDGKRFAVLRCSHECIVGIHDSHRIVVHPAGWLPEAKAHRGDRLNGFVGCAFGVGPILTYSTKVGKSHLDFNARWVHEFENRKRPQGDLFQLSATLKF